MILSEVTDLLQIKIPSQVIISLCGHPEIQFSRRFDPEIIVKLFNVSIYVDGECPKHVVTRNYP